MDLRRGDLQQRGLAGAVGAEHHPALVLLDRPVDARRAGWPAPADGDVGELENGVHVLRCRLVRGGRGRPTYTGDAATERDAGLRRQAAAAAAYARRVSTSRAAAVGAFALWFTAWCRGPASLDDTRDAIVGRRRRARRGRAARRDRRAAADPGARPAARRRRHRRGHRAARARRPAGAGRPARVQHRGRSRPARRWCSSAPTSDWCPHADGCRRRVALPSRRSPGASCPTRRRPTARCGRAARGRRGAGRPRRRPVAARGRRRADERCGAADVTVPGRDVARARASWPSRPCGAAHRRPRPGGRRRRVTAAGGGRSAAAALAPLDHAARRGLVAACTFRWER